MPSAGSEYDRIERKSQVHTHNRVILPQLQIIGQVLDLFSVRPPAAGVGQVLDLESFFDEVVVEERVWLAVFAREADLWRAAALVG